nr:MAG TPA: hypothetical protein [Caudoviricetes sp.]
MPIIYADLHCFRDKNKSFRSLKGPKFLSP